MAERHYRWQRYGSDRTDAGVTHYAVGPGYIALQFKSAERYLYDHTVPGRPEVEAMKNLAHAGKGLTTFINQHVGSHYAARLR